MNYGPVIARCQTDAVGWLEAHGGEAVLCKRHRAYGLVGTNRTLLAQGQKSGFGFEVWEALAAAGKVEFSDDGKTIKLTASS